MHKASVSTRAYWLLQMAGWGSILGTNLFFVERMGRLHRADVQHSLLYLSLGITVSHLMRGAIRRARLIDGTNIRFVTGVFLTTCAFALLHSCVEFSIIRLTGLRVGLESNLDPGTLFLRRTYASSFLYFGWSAIYSVVLLFRKSGALQLDRIHQIERQHELELKSIKASLNPHFVFNALNSIRALIDEEPARARNAVTSLGNILHRSLEAGEQDTVTLQRELDIVRDYLSLQQIRFEDRLKVEYEVDSDTLDLPLPTMMLQTLVENAVKHGVDRSIRGGFLHVTARVPEGSLELCVRNAGRMEPDPSRKGFGLRSVSDRLALLYGKTARFEIAEKPGSVVEALLSIPAHPAEARLPATPRGAMRPLAGA